MTIRPVSKNGRPAFLLDGGTIGGRRRRFFFKTKRDAERKRDQLLQDRRAVKGEVIAARNLGHSEAVLHQHYRALVTQAQATAFFALLPSKD